MSGNILTRPLHDFLRWEAAGGIVMVLAAALAIAIANSPLRGLYEQALALPIGAGLGPLTLAKPLLLWINDGLMALFFLLVGLEVKREFAGGELATRSQAVLPAAAAVGGMAVPALLYAAVTWNTPTVAGWAIPAATDIAFALVVLQLVGTRAPMALKSLLTAIAIFDDLGAIVVIALFYTNGLAPVALALAVVAGAGLAALNLAGVRRLTPYLILGSVLWICVLKSGVHATLAGVVTALAIPLGKTTADGSDAPLERLEHALHPWVAFAILPLFGFANAGLSFTGMSLADLAEPLPLGILVGLLIGKPMGVFGAIWLAVYSGLASLPAGVVWRQILALAVICGIGFTMSLFIGSLAFPDPSMEAPLRLGVLAASLPAALAGFALLHGKMARWRI